MKVVFSIGGSVIFPKEGSREEEYKEVIGRLSKSHEIKIVIGGGGKAREVVAEARKKGLNEGKCDELAIRVTRENAKKLIEVLGFGFGEVPLAIDEAASIKGLTIMGGTHIGHTTDAVAAMLAEYWDADLLVIGTNVDAVYSEDPDKNPEAERFEKLTARELVEITMKNVMKATSAGVSTRTPPRLSRGRESGHGLWMRELRRTWKRQSLRISGPKSTNYGAQKGRFLVV